MDYVVRSVRTPDGRRLRVVEGGRNDGLPVLMHHGCPGSGNLYGPHVQDARDKGIRLIAYDRPGYGGSTRHAGCAVADSAADVHAIAEALGIHRLGVWGVSGGGPHALACAALLSDLVVAVGTLASPAPYGVEGFDYFEGMSQENVDDIKLMLDDEVAALARLPADREAALAVTPETMRSNSDAGAAPLDPELSAWLVGTMQAGLALSADGWWDDSSAQLRPWGFDIEAIRVPVQLWHGRQDRFVPFQHGEWLAAHIPGVDAHLTEVDGHATLVQHRVPGLHGWLLEHF